MTNLAVLASGRGSNLQAIIDNIENGYLKARITVVISDVGDAYALERARKHGIEAVSINPENFATKESYEKEILGVLKAHDAELVLLAGYMRVVGQTLLAAYKNRMLNIHPALLPAFPGLHAQKQALDYGVRFSGCTVHLVDCGTDTGPIILQAIVPVEEDDSEESLSARIQKEEHRIFPEAVRLFCDGKIRVEGRHVRIMS